MAIQNSGKPKEKYNLSEVIIQNQDYSIYQNIPKRETETFEGRRKELDKLNNWINDQDSRICLIYGDGGYGKTTLVLEFLNRFIEDRLDLNLPIPEILSFHTAKMTKWDERGLNRMSGVANVMDECIRELIRLFIPSLSKEWYQVDGERLIQKATNFLKDEKYTRDDVLLIFDNTETLATSTHAVEELGEFLVSVSKKIGRLIITSRRRELVNATPIPVADLGESECINLMRRLAKEYNAKPIIQAGEPRLRSISKQLAYKPLLINALVKHIGLTNIAIDAGIDKLFLQSNEELLTFLYDDAWARMNDSQKKVCILLVVPSHPIDQNSLKKSCQLVKMPLSEFHQAFDETYFGTITSYGEIFSIELADLATSFFQAKFKSLSEAECNEIRSYAEEVDNFCIERDRIEKEYKEDRVAEAFRSPFAKAAKIETKKGNNPEANEMYQLAIEDEPLNSSLHDRYAWFLFHEMRDSENADKMWGKAIEINPNNCDALVNIALSKYRQSDLTSGDAYIDKSRSLGRTFSFCYLNKGKARFHLWRRTDKNFRTIKTLEESLTFLQEAQKKLDRNEAFYTKNKNEILKLIVTINAEIRNSRK